MQLDDVVSSTVTGPRVEEAMHRSVYVWVVRAWEKDLDRVLLLRLPSHWRFCDLPGTLLQVSALAGQMHCSPSAPGQAEPLCYHPGGTECRPSDHLPER